MQDRALEGLQRGPGLDPELLDERASGFSVDLEGLCLAPGAVEREHPLRDEPFLERVAMRKHVELADQLHVLAESQVGFDPLRQRRQAKLLQSVDVRLREPLVGEVDERRAAPELERRAQCRCCELGLARRESTSADLELLDEALDVDLPRLDSQCVPATARDEDTVTEGATELRHVVLEDLGRAGRRRARPELLDELLRADGLVRVQEQESEQSRLLAADDPDGNTVGIDLERPKDPVIHRSPSVNVAAATSDMNRGMTARCRPSTRNEPMLDRDGSLSAHDVAGTPFASPGSALPLGVGVRRSRRARARIVG